MLSEDDILDGDSVLPGFWLPIREWFERAWQQAGRGAENRGKE